MVYSGVYRGLGQCCADAECTTLGPPCFGGGGDTGGNGIDWTKIFQTGITTAGGIVKQITNPMYNLPPGTYIQTGPYGTVASTAGIPGTAVSSALTSSLTSMMPLLLVGAGVLLLVTVAGKR
jgi:hypothetical protein